MSAARSTRRTSVSSTVTFPMTSPAVSATRTTAARYCRATTDARACHQMMPTCGMVRSSLGSTRLDMRVRDREPGFTRQPDKGAADLDQVAVGVIFHLGVELPAILRRLRHQIMHRPRQGIGALAHGVEHELWQHRHDRLTADLLLEGLHTGLAPGGRGVWGGDGRDVDG